MSAFGALKVADKATDEVFDDDCLLGQMLKFVWGDVRLVQRDVEMGLYFGRGTQSIPQESDELGVGSRVKALGNVGHDGYGCPTDLVCKTEVPSEPVGVSDFIDDPRKVPCFLPRFDVFKAGDGHGSGSKVQGPRSKVQGPRSKIQCGLL